MATQEFIQALITELTTDPATIGYGPPPADWFDEAAALSDYNLMTAKNRSVDRETMSGSEIFEAIDVGEWGSRSADQKDDIKFVVSLGDNIQISPGTKARSMLQNALTGATASLANLGAISQRTVSRAEELGLTGLKVGHIQLARRDAP